jgi:hypothetical protein
MISTWQEEFGSTFSPSGCQSANLMGPPATWPKAVRPVPQASLGNMPCGCLVIGCGGKGDDVLAVRGRGRTRQNSESYLGNLQRLPVLRQLSLRVAASPTLESITHNLRNVYKVE